VDDQNKPARSFNKRELAASLLIAFVVFLSRFFTQRPVYFIDGPHLVTVIQQRTYVVQAPGYWLFARTAGLFPNPALGLLSLNEICSSLGAGVYFLLCLELELPLFLSLLSAFTFASVFFVWFAGDVHSSYATQLLFPVLSAWLLVRYARTGLLWLLLASTVSLAIGTGMRPSDGVFLLPLFAVVLFFRVKISAHRWLAIALFVLVCVGWYVPTALAYRSVDRALIGQLDSVAVTSSVLWGASPARVVANAARLVIPLAVAFWMLVPAWFSSRVRGASLPLILWFAPGFLFYLIVFMANPTYIVFAVAPLVLLASLICNRRLAVATLSVCFLWNTVFFLAARPIRRQNLAALSLDYYAIMYTDFGLRHSWNEKISNGIRIP
jgi:hypothetical protein